MRALLSFAASCLLALAATGAGGAASLAAGTARPCTFYAATSGDDANPGSASRPFRTVSKLAWSLKPGGVGCLLGGETFDERVVVTHGGSPNKPITIQSDPVARATIVGGITIDRTAPDVRLYNLVLRGTSGDTAPVVEIQGDRVQLLVADVSGDPDPSVGACVAIAGAQRVVVDGSSVHDCGVDGIQVGSSAHDVISSNLLWRNAGDAVALEDGSKDVLVTRNVVDGNQSGVYLRGANGSTNGRNTIKANVISNSTRYDLHADYAGQDRVASGNVVAGNCMWRAGVKVMGTATHGAYTVSGNVLADPRFIDRATSLAMKPGPCFARRPVSRTDDAYLVGGRLPLLVLPKLPPFLIAFDGRSYSMYPLQTGSTVRISCASGCRGAFQATVRHGTRLRTEKLVGRHGVLRFQETHAGWIGRYKLLVVPAHGAPHSKPGPYTAYCLRPRPKRC